MYLPLFWKDRFLKKKKINLHFLCSLLQIFFFDASGNRGIGADMGMLDTAYFLSYMYPKILDF
jgi:hypothetical protein